MVQLKITEEERELLMEILENDISDLRMEIADTDRREYREMLKNREVLMKKIPDSGGFCGFRKNVHFDTEIGVFEPKTPVKSSDSGRCAPLLGHNHKFH